MKIPIFPLSGAVMFPKTNLPLNIFEKRYIDMVDYSLSGNRLIGMIQQKQNEELYNVGCYGKITVFNETADKRYLINLEGVSCFKIVKEVETTYNFKVCEVETYNSYSDSILQDNLKSKLLDCFEKYNNIKKINISLDEVSELGVVDLLKLIVMISPFDVSIKQMFLELKSNVELYENVLSTLEIELVTTQQTKSIN